MKKLLQALIILIGIAALAFLLAEPWFEGRNAGATFTKVYFQDAFLAYAYAGSIAFFVGLYNAYKLAGGTPHALQAVRTIKRCATALVVLIAAPVAYLIIVRPEDDIAGGVAMGVMLITLSAVTALVAAHREKKMRA